MSPRRYLSILAALALLAAIVPAPVRAGNDFSQVTFGSNFFNASPPCPVNQFPTFETIAPVPAIIDLFGLDSVPMFCEIQVDKRGGGVKKAKGTFDTELIVIDNVSGEAEVFPIKSGRFKTGSDGRSNFDFELPAELFADGFESGDVSAWSYTRSDFTNKKKADGVSVSCGVAVSRSGN